MEILGEKEIKKIQDTFKKYYWINMTFADILGWAQAMEPEIPVAWYKGKSPKQIYRAIQSED